MGHPDARRSTLCPRAPPQPHLCGVPRGSFNLGWNWAAAAERSFFFPSREEGGNEQAGASDFLTLNFHFPPKLWTGPASPFSSDTRLRDGGCSQAPLINGLHSAKVVNLSHPLTLPTLMYFHVYKFF